MSADSEPPARELPKRVRKRELERRRHQQQRLLVIGGAVGAVAVLVAAAILLIPPAQPPHACAAGEICDAKKPMHIHPHLQVLVDGVERQIPSNIGLQGGPWVSHELDQYIDPNEVRGGAQLSPLHTHDSSGIIHVEAAVTRGFTLGEFFAVWGQPLGPQQTWNMAANSNHQLTLEVDGVASGLWESLLLQDGQHIVVRYNTI